MTEYMLIHKWHGNRCIVEAKSVEAAWQVYAADPGDFTGADDEPFDADDLLIREVLS